MQQPTTILRMASTAIVLLLIFSECDAFIFASKASHMTSNVRPSAIRRVDESTSLGSRPDASLVAQGLGYLVGAGSLLLYTPIVLRLCLQGTADGLAMSTWWTKIVSYTCSNIYAFTHGYPISTYAETIIITVEALVILVLVAYYQNRIDAQFGTGAIVFVGSALLLANGPSELIAFGQASSAVLNTGALVPQFILNAQLQTSGDYSPITAGLASTGCLIRLFTTVQLADSDPLLLGSYGLALLVNSALLAQILYYGVAVEGKGVLSVLISDLGPTDTSDIELVAEQNYEEDGKTTELLTQR
jgi:mannose-P-dolichol utilization defect protein 1